jgi:hypothetical protein
VQLYLFDKEGIMVFQLRPEDTRPYQYPNAQDIDFLGYDREADRWKVEASGIKLYASGISVELDKDDDSVSVWSASGTPTLPVYIENTSLPVTVAIDKDTDSISVWSSSGTPSVETYISDSVSVYSSDPMDGILVKKRITYNSLGDPIQVKEATIATPSGQPCVVKDITYNDLNDPDYVTERYGTW